MASLVKLIYLFCSCKILTFLLLILWSEYSAGQSNLKVDSINQMAIGLIQDGKNIEVVSLMSRQEPESISDSLEAEYVLFYHIFAQALHDLNEAELCIRVCQKCIEIISNSHEPKAYQIAELYMLEYLSTNLHKTNEYYRSILFSNKGLALENSSPESLLLFNNNIANSYQGLGDIDNSLKYYSQCLDLIPSLPEIYFFNKAFVLQNISKSYFLLGELDSSITYLEASINLQELQPEIFNHSFFTLYATAANRYLSAGRIDDAKIYFSKAEEHYHENAPITEVAYFYEIRGKIRALNDNFGRAASDFTLARDKIGQRDSALQVRTVYPTEYLSILNTELDMYKQQHESTQTDGTLQTYLAQSESTLQEALFIIRVLPSDAIKHALIIHLKAIYAHVLNATWLNLEADPDRLSRASLISIFESYQAQLIGQEVNQKHWLNNGVISTELLQQLKHLEHQYDSLLHASYQLSPSKDLESAYAKNNHQVYVLEDSIRNLQASLRADYPVYNALLEQQDELNEANLNLIFKKFKSVLMFFEEEDYLYTFYLTSESQQLRRFELSDKFYSTVNRWSTNLAQLPMAAANSGEYKREVYRLHEDGNYLYNELIKPLNTSLADQVLIIPDGSISNISFSALNKNIPEDALTFAAANYLIEDSHISTHFSLKLVAQMLKGQSANIASVRYFTPNQSELSIPSPISSDTLILSALPFSKAESQLLRDLLNAEQINQTMSNEGMIDRMRNASILHFGSHVVLNDEFPDQSYIPFLSDSGSLRTLKPYELFASPLSNSLVVANACHSGRGKSMMGRGLLSFVSGFVLADARCILSSRWAVQDKAGYEFMHDFYHSIHKDQPVETSLRQAQLSRLHGHDPLLAHPSNWASYYIIGDGSISFGQSNSWVYLMLGVGLFIVLFLLFKIFRKRDKSK